MGYVSNRGLREAFERSDLTAMDLADRLGYRYSASDGSLRPNDAAVKAALGLKRCRARGKARRWVVQRKMREETALRYMEAMNLDPVDVGL